MAKVTDKREVSYNLELSEREAQIVKKPIGLVAGDFYHDTLNIYSALDNANVGDLNATAESKNGVLVFKEVK